ncbi:tyrosine-type recombinase/integrase [Methylobacterium aquaticum]|uniref:tyrosine-type recombinase/integrase n=1 Tax=Methylobacterium aquaticum TaxID=270351 RepID=UPI001932FEA5|nr:tyrosine-type recombinase/integrase [Methylobacterium aquaticum]QRE76774.1 tyrosine-type recombinase/integrase [Methylobacterium aquaticum]
MQETSTIPSTTRVPWNRGRIVGPKPPLKPKHIWALRTHLQLANRTRDLALFNLAVDSKLRGCDLVRLRVSDVHLGDAVRLRATVCQQKTGRPVPFEITEPTREALADWLTSRSLRAGDWLFPSRSRRSQHLTTRHYGIAPFLWTVMGLG